MDDIDTAINSHLVHVNNIIDSATCDVSLSKAAWEGKVLYQAASAEQKASFVSSYLKSVSMPDRFNE
jgi:hypothetical protein